MPPLATGNVPVTPVVSGRPVRLVATPDVGVPSNGVTRVGDVLKTVSPVPVLVVTPVPPLATASVPPSVNVPAVVIGPPVNVRPVVPPDPDIEVTVPVPLARNHAYAEPVHLRKVFDTVGAAMKDVTPTFVWYGI